MGISYYNSGLHTKAFYTEQYIDFFKKDIYLLDEVEYDRELFYEYNKDKLELFKDEDEKLEEIDNKFYRNLGYCKTYFRPLIFDKEIALECRLTPFEYQGLKLLALSGYGMDLSHKLDAYQVLTYNKIDPQSKVFTCRYYREDFENIVGKEITQEILQNWEKLNGKNLRI